MATALSVVALFAERDALRQRDKQVPARHGHALHGIEDATMLRITDEPIMAKFLFGVHGVAGD